MLVRTSKVHSLLSQPSTSPSDWESLPKQSIGDQLSYLESSRELPSQGAILTKTDQSHEEEGNIPRYFSEFMRILWRAEAIFTPFANFKLLEISFHYRRYIWRGRDASSWPAHQL